MGGVVRTRVTLSLGQGAPNKVPTAHTYKTDSEATEAEPEVQTSHSTPQEILGQNYRETMV